MPISSIVKTKRDGTLLIADNGGVHSLTVAFSAGDFNLTIPGPTVNNFLDRGQITSPPSIRYGDDAPMTFSFTGYLRDLSDATFATLEEIIMQSGFVGTTWVSTMGATGEVFALSLTWTIAGIAHGDAANHVITLPYSVFTGSLAEGDPSNISISGTSFALYPTIVT